MSYVCKVYLASPIGLHHVEERTGDQVSDTLQPIEHWVQAVYGYHGPRVSLIQMKDVSRFNCSNGGLLRRQDLKTHAGGYPILPKYRNGKYVSSNSSCAS